APALAVQVKVGGAAVVALVGPVTVGVVRAPATVKSISALQPPALPLLSTACAKTWHVPAASAVAVAGLWLGTPPYSSHPPFRLVVSLSPHRPSGVAPALAVQVKVGSVLLMVPVGPVTVGMPGAGWGLMPWTSQPMSLRAAKSSSVKATRLPASMPGDIVT